MFDEREFSSQEEATFWNDTYGRMQNRVDTYIDANRTVNSEYLNRVSYSAWGSEEDEFRINLDEVAVEGPVIFVQEHDEFWGPGEDYKSELVENPTWLELCLLANDMINVTGDHHHIFLEGVYQLKDKFGVTEKDWVKVYRFSMGS